MIATAVHGIVFDVSHIYREQPAPYPCTSFAQGSLAQLPTRSLKWWRQLLCPGRSSCAVSPLLPTLFCSL